MAAIDQKEKNPTYVLILIVLILSAGIIAISYLYFRNYEKQYRIEVEQKLSAVADLKVGELVQWRRERLGDAAVFFRNEAFSSLVRRYFNNPTDLDVHRQLWTWLSIVQILYSYERIFLLDARGALRMSIPDSQEPIDSNLARRAAIVMRSGHIDFQDFHRNEQDQRVYLTSMIPILGKINDEQALGLIALRIDPETYLYPFIGSWPAPSRTAETMLVRREGKEVVFLNELRFRKDTALKLRFPLDKVELPAVKAVLGQEGIVEGTDYRGVMVLAAIRAIRDSPWFLIARMDTSEVYAPIRERLWLMIFLVVALLTGTGSAIGLVWRRQHIRFYREKYEAEEALRNSEIRYQSIFENTGTVMLIIEQDMTISVTNAEFEKLTGYRRKEVEGKKKWTEFVEKSDLERMMEQHRLRRTDKDLAKRSYEFRLVHRDGHIKDIYLIVDIIPGTGKSVGSLIDITERKRAEEALRDANWRMESIIEGTHVGTWEWNIQTGETVFNEAWAQIIGYTLDELAPISIKTWETFVHPDDLKQSGELLERHFAGELPDYDLECRMKHKDGHWVWVHDRGRVITRTSDGKPLMMFGIHTDITERKRTEEKLVLNSQRTQVLLQLGQMTGASLKEITDFALEKAVELTQSKIGYLAFLNEDESVLTMHSWSKSAMAECAIADKPILYPVETTGLWGEAIRQRRPVITNDYTTSPWKKGYPDGHVSVWRHMNAPVFLGSRIVLVAGVGNKSDVYNHNDVQQMTLIMEGMWRLIERKRAEEEKRILEERLRHADKMEAIGTLAGGIAHDFNNLLMGIQGYASLTLLDLDSSHPHYERLKRIEEQVQSGADLTRQLLGFARGGRYEVKPADMNDILKKSSTMFGRTKKEITIHRKYGKDLRSVEVDRGQMDQVFMNLYVNAWQAMPGGGEIYLETENVLLSDEQAVSCSVRPGNYVKISVTDTGTGMDEKTRERIFDPFFTTKGMGRGTGLGLATVYGIIKGHRGAINVYSEPGHGTTFNIYLPASEREVIGEKAETGTIARGAETILLADDEKMVLEVSREMLESLGYRVHAAGSGQEAIAVYMEKRQEIDLVILDMIMPGISGGETFDRLREINSAVRVLLSSGYSINGEAKHILDRGCNGFLQKPFHLAKLSRMIREMLD